MVKATCDHTRGLLLAEAIRTRAKRETGDEALAWARTRKDIAAGGLVTVTAETESGAPFELPPGCTWAHANYNLRKSRAWWRVGSKPPVRVVGKVKPRDTRKVVVAYCIRVIQASVDAPPAAQTVKDRDLPLNKATTKPEPPVRPGDTENERRARVFLYCVMARNPTGLAGRTKGNFQRVCLKRFKVTGRRFNALWDDSKADSGAKGYAKTGPRGPHKRRPK